MLVVGTPRPASVLGEVADNGFFESISNSEEEFEDFNDEDLEDGDLSDETNGEGRRGSRARSESFHELYDEKAKIPPIILSGTQTLLPRQLNIVTNLASIVDKQKPLFDNVSAEELAEEELLEKEESIALERWRAVGGRGRPDENTDSVRKSGRRRGSIQQLIAASSARPASTGAIVVAPGAHDSDISGQFSDMLPQYEDKVRIFVLCSPAKETKMEWRTSDLSDAGGRRVRCELWEYSPSPTFDDDGEILDVYVRTSDAVVSLGPYNEWTGKIINRARELDRVVVVNNAFGVARKSSTKLGIHFDSKGSSWVEIAARDVVLKNARLRGEKKPILQLMERQLRKTDRSKGTSCSLM